MKLVGQLFLLGVVGLTFPLTTGTHADDIPLYLEQRYDEIVLTPEYDDVRLQVFPLKFGPTTIPTASDEPLRIRLIDYPDREYDVAWNDIAKIDFFEDALIAEATELFGQGKFEEAYNELRFVWKSAPKWRRLEAAISGFLVADSAAAYRARHFDEAIVVLEERFRRGPTTKIAKAIATVVDRAFSSHLSQDDFVRARQLISWVSNRPRLKQQERVVAWSKQLRELADQQLELARTAATDKRYREALSAVDRALQILPNDAPAREFANSILTEYPRVAVAVPRTAATHANVNSDWVDLRVSRLVNRRLVELTEYRAEGGRYQSGYGQLELDSSGSGMTLVIPQAADSREAQNVVLDTLLRASQPSGEYADRYLSQLLELVKEEDDGVRLQVAKDTLRWLPLLNVPLVQRLNQWQPFQREEESQLRQSFLANQQYVGRSKPQIAEIMEREYPRQSDMIHAIESGEVDIVERLLPAEADQIKSRDVVVDRYGPISMYFLVPNRHSKLASNRAFRRGVVYAIPRQTLLSQSLLIGRSNEGCQVLSGPFHAGFDRSDPMAYAYDPEVKPRAFEPALGATLISMSWHIAEMDAQDEKIAQAETNETGNDEATSESAPESSPTTESENDNRAKRIVMVHAKDAILAAQADLICRSLRSAGIRCETRDLSAGSTRPPEDDSWHLWLADVAVLEPIVDIFQMYGPQGLVPEPSSYVQQALNELAEVNRWSDARAVLNQLHELIHNELSVIPLWQLTNHYAYRRGLQGLSGNVTSLYQNVDQWTVNRSSAP